MTLLKKAFDIFILNSISNNSINFTLFIIYAFYLMSWNWGFLPVTEGFFLIAGKAINSGQMPYKDFYAYLPPAYYWLSALLTYVDDLGLQAGRALGFGIMLLFYPIIYNLYSRWFDKGFELSVCTFFSLIILTSSTAFLSYDFTQIVILFSLLGWLLLTFDSTKYLFFSGSALAIATLIKQSNGAAVTLIALLYVLFKYKNDLKKIFAFILGGLVTTILIFLPIILYSDILLAINSILIEASNNKGGGINALYNWFTKGFYSFEKIKDLSLVIIKISIFIIFNYFVLYFINYTRNPKRYIYSTILIFILLSVHTVIYNIEALNYITKTFFWRDIFLVSGYIGFIIILLKVITNKNFTSNYQAINLSSGLLNSSLILGSGMSGGLTKTSIFFTVGFIILFIIQISKNNVFVKFSLIILCLFVSLDLVKNKYDKPYKWWGYDSKSSKIFNFNIKNLESFKQQNNLNIYLENCKLKPKNLLPFPHMTMFNIITNTKHFRKSTVLWFDFLSDNHAKEVLLEIEKNPPDSFILWHPPQNAFEAHSNLFKNGRKLVHLDIYNYLKSKKIKSEYYQKYIFTVTGTEFELYLHKKLNCE